MFVIYGGIVQYLGHGRSMSVPDTSQTLLQHGPKDLALLLLLRLPVPPEALGEALQLLTSLLADVASDPGGKLLLLVSDLCEEVWMWEVVGACEVRFQNR